NGCPAMNLMTGAKCCPYSVKCRKGCSLSWSSTSLVCEWASNPTGKVSKMEQDVMTPNVRLTRPNDINYIRDLDMKCYHYPLSMDNWKALINGSGKMGQARVVVVEVDRTPVGFAVWNYETIKRGNN